MKSLLSYFLLCTQLARSWSCDISSRLLEETNEILFPHVDYSFLHRHHEHPVNPEWFFSMGDCHPFFSESNNVLLISGSECRQIPVKQTVEADIHVKISLKMTRIQTIWSHAFSTWKKVKELEISENNRLTVIENDAFDGMTDLTKLLIRNNYKLYNMHPDAFSKLNNLKELIITGNGFFTISTITKSLKPTSVPQLYKLDVSDNPFKSVLSHDFNDMSQTSLTELIMKDINFTKVEHEAISHFTNLKKLEIGPSQPSSEWTTIIKHLTENEYLTELVLNKLKESQSEEVLTKLLLNSDLKSLAIKDSSIGEINIDGYSEVVDLEHIELSRSNIEQIPVILFNSKIFPMVNKIILKHNRIRHIPNVIGATPVKLLDLTGNRLKSLIERAIYFAPELEVLMLTDNKMDIIEENAFASNGDLIVLTLNQNNFEESTYLFTKEVFNGLDNLKVLDMSQCRIRTFMNLDVFDNLKSLQTLSLKSNFIRYVDPEWFVNMGCLRKLDLRGNHFHYLNPSFLLRNNQIHDVGLMSRIYRVDSGLLDWLNMHKATEEEYKDLKNCTNILLVTESDENTSHLSGNCRIVITRGDDSFDYPVVEASPGTDIEVDITLTNSTTGESAFDFIIVLFKPSHVYNSLSSKDTWSILRFIYVFMFYLIVFGLIVILTIKFIGYMKKIKKRTRPCLIFDDKPDYSGIENKSFNVPYEKMTDIKLSLGSEKQI